MHFRKLAQKRNDFTDAQDLLSPYPSGLVLASFSNPLEVMMSREITFDRGSKRRMRQIRWTFGEVLSAIFLSFIVLGLCAFIEALELIHGSAESKTHIVKAQR